MAISIPNGVDSQTITTTEWSMMSLSNFPDTPATADGVYQLMLGLGDMVAGDELQVRIYEKVRSGDTQRIVYQVNLVGPQSQGFVFPGLILMHGWDMTLDCIAGTTIDVEHAIYKVA